MSHLTFIHVCTKYVVPDVSIGSRHINFAYIIHLPSLPNRFWPSISWPSCSRCCHHAQFIWKCGSHSLKSSGSWFRRTFNRSQRKIFYTITRAHLRTRLPWCKSYEKCSLKNSFIENWIVWRDKRARKSGRSLHFSVGCIVHDTCRIVVRAGGINLFAVSALTKRAHMFLGLCGIHIIRILKEKIQPSGRNRIYVK